MSLPSVYTIGRTDVPQHYENASALSGAGTHTTSGTQNLSAPTSTDSAHTIWSLYPQSSADHETVIDDNAEATMHALCTAVMRTLGQLSEAGDVSAGNLLRCASTVGLACQYTAMIEGYH